MATPALPAPELLREFRGRYYALQQRVVQGISTSLGDTTVLERLGDDVDEFLRLVRQHIAILTAEEATTFQTNLTTLQREVGQAYQHSLDASHLGRPQVVRIERTGRPGRPRIVIEPQFLEQASVHRGATKISRVVNCSRSTVRKALLEAGLARPGRNPFPTDNADPQPVHQQQHLNDSELDEQLVNLRVHFPNAGITMLDGMLRRMRFPTSRARIATSLHRIDPVRRVFERVRIKRRKYKVPGPNSLWHHDGQHGLIRWKIVLHGFIDGHSRVVTGLRASNNNLGSTVLDVFLRAARQFGVPSRLRGDHGVENILVAAFMEMRNGIRRGSYIWGRSVHNIRIERLWVDVTTQFGAKWHELFEHLEVDHGLDINNDDHLWLLHYLFLADINADCAFFAEAWNYHKIQTPGQPTRSPYDMWYFDQIANGIRGEELPEQELENFGVDWEGLREASLLRSWQGNNQRAAEGVSSWVGRVGPPADLSEVTVEPPAAHGLTEQDGHALYAFVVPLMGSYDRASLILRWSQALAFCRTRSANF